jgi:hypothetical protein
MSGERLSMRKIREVLQLRLDQGLPPRAVAQSLGLSQGAVHVRWPPKTGRAAKRESSLERPVGRR